MPEPQRDSGHDALDVRDVTVSFDGPPVLNGVSLRVQPHEIVALQGPSGSGKSTLLRVISGLLRPDSGLVLIDGVDVTTTPTHRRGVGMVFQDEQLFPHRTVRQNVEFGLRMHGWNRSDRARRVDELLELVGLRSFGERRVTDLSGGEAKRVALVRTLAPSPRIVLLDEPLTGLDRELHDALAIEVRNTLLTARATAILVTHDRVEADAIADRTVSVQSLRHSAGDEI